MKISQIGKYYPPHKGGIESHVYSLVENLKNMAGKIEVLVFNSGHFSKTTQNENVKITRCGKLFELLATPFSFKMFFSMCKLNSDIIHIHLPNPSAHFYLSFCELIFGKKKGKLVLTHHSDIISQKITYKLYKPLLRKLYKKADRIIAATENHVKYSDILPEFQNKISIVPYGINIKDFELTDEIKERVKKTRKFLDNKQIALFIGRLVYYKGVSYLIESFNELNLENTALVIIGNGPYFSTLKAQSIHNENVIFIPEADDKQLKVFLHACDFFVLPSVEKSEAFGIVQLEAMTCRKPVISTTLDSGVKSVNIHNKTGIQVEPKNKQELISAMKTLFEKKELRNELGENAYKHVEENYSDSKCAQKIYNIYKELIK